MAGAKLTNLLPVGKIGAGFVDLRGRKFGRLLAVEPAGRAADGSIYWLCRCECENEILVRGCAIRNGNTSSCRCLEKELTIARLTKHGKSGTSEHNRWMSMLSRCQNPNSLAYGHYGGRGILVCDAWHDFEVFMSNMGPMPSPKHQIERRDNNGPYSPDNCYWATVSQQSRNRRSNVLIEHNGRLLTLIDYAAEIGLPYSTVHQRWKHGALPGAFKRCPTNDEGGKSH